MAFTLYGLSGPGQLPNKTEFKRLPLVGKVERMDKTHSTRKKLHDHDAHGQAAKRAYSDIEKLNRTLPVLTAEMLMSSPVIMLTSDSQIDEEHSHFKDNLFRHIPVENADATLVGIISDRDIFRYLAGLTESKQRQQP